MKKFKLLLISVLLLFAALHAGQCAFAGSTLDKIRAAGSLNCGVNIEEAEYTINDAHGNRAVFDADLCKAIAVALLGSQAKFKLVPYRDEEESLKGLKSGEVAVVASASPNIRTTAASSGLGFSRPVLYDFQGLLVNKAMGIASPKDLAGKKTCFIVDSEMEYQVAAYMAREKIKWIPGPFSEEGEMEAALLTENCAAISADVTQLAFERIAFRKLAKNFDILPDVVAKEPLAAAYRLDDPQWAAVVNWTIEALIQAEESGITQSNAGEMKKSDDMVVQRLLGTQKGYGQFLGLDDAWAARVIESVGNYGEVFERDLGAGSPMKLARGPNNLWTHGGLMYAIPIR
jgi:general L-amino acid transport system substrate-binding protein